MISERTSDSGRIETAIDAVIGELATINSWLSELDDEVRIGLNRREKLVKAADGLILTLDDDAQPAFRRRFARQALRGKLRPLPRKTTLDDVIAFLADRDEETVTPRDVRSYLFLNGINREEKYAVNALLKLEKSGVLLRAGYGAYTINRQHPLILRAQMTVAKRIEAGLR